jgi:hypothetical protein
MLDINRERATFERLTFDYFLHRREAGHIDPSDQGDGTPEALFWKDDLGNYGVRMFNAAWWAWKARAAIALEELEVDRDSR